MKVFRGMTRAQGRMNQEVQRMKRRCCNCRLEQPVWSVAENCRSSCDDDNVADGEGQKRHASVGKNDVFISEALPFPSLPPLRHSINLQH